MHHSLNCTFSPLGQVRPSLQNGPSFPNIHIHFLVFRLPFTYSSLHILILSNPLPANTVRIPFHHFILFHLIPFFRPPSSILPYHHIPSNQASLQSSSTTIIIQCLPLLEYHTHTHSTRHGPLFLIPSSKSRASLNPNHPITSDQHVDLRRNP